MPIPLILAGVAIAAGGYGVKKGLEAQDNFEQAHWVNAEARMIFELAAEQLQVQREHTQQQLQQLGTDKFRLYEQQLVPFVEALQKIRQFNYQDAHFYPEQLSPPSVQEIQDLERSASSARDTVSLGLAALGAGGLAGMAAYGTAGVLGSTAGGTAIASLSGAAATNATLAWFGGGALSAGGFGMAGGTVILGGIVAGPVLAVGGLLLAAKAEEAIQQACSKREEAELAAQQMQAAGHAAQQIGQQVLALQSVLHELEQRFQPYLAKVQLFIQYETNYHRYTPHNKRIVATALSLAKLLRELLEAPLLQQDGALVDSTPALLTRARAMLTGIPPV